MILKIAVAVCVEPMAMVLRAMLKKTTNQTALRGVWVFGWTFERVLFVLRVSASFAFVNHEGTGHTKKTAMRRREQRHTPSVYQLTSPNNQ